MARVLLVFNNFSLSLPCSSREREKEEAATQKSVLLFGVGTGDLCVYLDGRCREVSISIIDRSRRTGIGDLVNQCAQKISFENKRCFDTMADNCGGEERSTTPFIQPQIREANAVPWCLK
jgi:hypothetical protein